MSHLCGSGGFKPTKVTVIIEQDREVFESPSRQVIAEQLSLLPTHFEEHRAPGS
jgi:hypothetical protein